MMKSLQGYPDPKRPIVWVTGASSGIGLEIAREFAAIGCVTCLSGRSVNLLNKAVKEIQKLGGRGYSFPCNVTDNRSVRTAHKKIVRTLGDVDVLVNNAGITSFKSFLDTSLKELEDIIQTNLLGNIYCTKEVLPAMIKKKKGAIFNIISYAAVKTFKNSSAYAASKAGIFAVGKAIREELGAHNIKVINILPGATETNMWHEKVRKKYSHRMMKPKSIAEAVVKIYRFPEDVVVDEIIMRPMMGDLG